MKNSLRPPVDKSDIHFTLSMGACLWVKENNIQLNEKWMQSSLKCRQSVVNSFFFSFFLPGAPSPAGHLRAAGIRREAGQHGYPRPRGRAQHHALWVPLPRGVQDAKAAYSHTAWVAGRLQQDYPLSCVSGLWARGDVVAVWMRRLCLMGSAGFMPLIERFVHLCPGFFVEQLVIIVDVMSVQLAQNWASLICVWFYLIFSKSDQSQCLFTKASR